MSDRRVIEVQGDRIAKLENAVQQFLVLWNSPGNTWLASTVPPPIQAALNQLTQALANQRMSG